MLIDALSISNEDLAMMRAILDRECASHGHSVTGVEGKRMARLIMDAYREGVLLEADLTALVHRAATQRLIPLTERYLKNFPVSR